MCVRVHAYGSVYLWAEAFAGRGVAERVVLESGGREACAGKAQCVCVCVRGGVGGGHSHAARMPIP